MATYKVIQDIEADDKLLGPLTLRQFVYAGMTVFGLYICVFLATHGGIYFIPVMLVPTLFCAFFAFPWSREQPTELWALARIRFLLKPRKRIWNQTGQRDLVTITAPKRVEHVYSDGLTQTEVKSRLRALADTIDTRGWAIKNTTMNPYAMPALIGSVDASERLIDPSTIPSDVPMENPDIYTDMMDPATNPQAQQFEHMLDASAQAHRQQLVASMQAPDVPAPSTATQGQTAGYWFLNQPAQTNIPSGQEMFGTDTVAPGASGSNQVLMPKNAEEALIEQLRDSAASTPKETSHLPTLLPLAEQERLEREKAAHQAANAQVTEPSDAAILELAQNDDLTIDTIKRQAKKVRPEDASDEVVISLH